MPWQINGTFLRNNPDFSGANVWQQDQSVPIKIVASRHDFHDEDIAQGITACLNRDGLNAMRANLPMGGFRITNLANGTQETDAASIGQTVTDASFDENSGILRLIRPFEPDITVFIPGGGSGGGGVSQINIGAGLTGPVNPITATGSISLEVVGTSQTFTGPFSSLTIDEHGRVRQVVQGVSSNTNISIARSSTTVTVQSSTGSDGAIPPASFTAAGVMTASDKSKLEALNDKAIPISAPYIVRGGAGSSPAFVSGEALLETNDWNPAASVTLSISDIDRDGRNAGIMLDVIRSNPSNFSVILSGLDQAAPARQFSTLSITGVSAPVTGGIRLQVNGRGATPNFVSGANYLIQFVPK